MAPASIDVRAVQGSSTVDADLQYSSKPNVKRQGWQRCIHGWMHKGKTRETETPGTSGRILGSLKITSQA
jgi:hypothetical protein